MPSTDYTYPSVYFAYLFFALMCGLAVYFFVKSRREGYWGDKGEEPKFQMFEDDHSSCSKKTALPGEPHE